MKLAVKYRNLYRDITIRLPKVKVSILHLSKLDEFKTDFSDFLVRQQFVDTMRPQIE